MVTYVVHLGFTIAREAIDAKWQSWAAVHLALHLLLYSDLLYLEENCFGLEKKHQCLKIINKGISILVYMSVSISTSRPGPGCSKLTTSLVNVLLKFQTLISNICQYFLLKKCEKLLPCKSFSHFFNKKYQCIW